MLAAEHLGPQTRIGGLNPVFVVCIGARAATTQEGVGGFFAEYDELAADPLNAFNQLLSRNRSGGGLPALNATFTYDDIGNTTSESTVSPAATTAYTWDRDNRLRAVTPPAPGVPTSYSYDANSLRIGRTDATGTTRYLRDGARVLAELDGANAVSTRYLNHPQRIDEVISFERGGTTYWPLTDALGSWYAVTDSTGALVRRFDFDVYGTRADLGGAGPTLDVGFTGQRHDANGLMAAIGVRPYMPRTGTWLQPDRAGMIDGPNRYAYVKNAPTIFIDPTGMFWDTLENFLFSNRVAHYIAFPSAEMRAAAETTAPLTLAALPSELWPLPPCLVNDYEAVEQRLMEVWAIIGMFTAGTATNANLQPIAFTGELGDELFIQYVWIGFPHEVFRAVAVHELIHVLQHDRLRNAGVEGGIQRSLTLNRSQAQTELEAYYVEEEYLKRELGP